MHKLIATIVLILIAPVLACAANHEFTGLPITAAGWTDFDTITDSGYGSARVLFVSSASGNDSTAASNIVSNGHYGVSDVTFDANGYFQAPGGVYAFSTIATAYAYCRDGYPDILLLERGGAWGAGLGVSYVNSGSAQATPHIIASYGSSGARPKLTDVEFNGSTQEYIVVSGIHFYSADWTTADRSVDVRNGASYQTFEDLYIEGTAGDITGSSSYIAFRRCIWLHGEAHDGQIFVQTMTNCLIEECLFYEPFDEDYTDESFFGRNIYYAHTGSSGVELRGNIFYSADREGVHLRDDCDFYDNLVVQNYVRVGDIGTSTRYTMAANIYENVLIESSPRSNIDPNTLCLLAQDGTKAYDNIITSPSNVDRNPMGILVIGNYSSTPTLPTAKNLEIYDNIVYDFTTSAGVGYGIKFDASLTDISNISVHDNDLQLVDGDGSGNVFSYPTSFLSYGTFANNNYYSDDAESGWFIQGNLSAWASASSETGASSTPVSYTSPTRTIGGYHGTLGGTATTAAFMTAALGQSRADWDTDLMAVAAINYIRAGFDKSSVSYSYSGAAGSVGFSAGGGSVGFSAGGGSVSFE